MDHQRFRSIHVQEIEEKVRNLCIKTNIEASEDLINAYKKAMDEERSPISRDIYKDYLENVEIARKYRIPLCQDTGMVVVFVELGQDVRIEGGYIYEAIEKGVERGYREGFLRDSTVDPITRERTKGYNTPPVIYVDIVPGSNLKITIVPKGFGSENMSGIKLLPPSAGREGIKDFVVKKVEEAGANACPPFVVGVGIGGTFEKAALLAKKALLRPIGKRHPEPRIAELEEEILQEINKLGIGAQGFGGTVTAFSVHIETFPTHIASIPVAVNIQCHIVRHGEVVL